MPRFFVPPEQIQNKKFTLVGSEARHAALVLRKKPGDVIDLFDGKDLSYQGRIDSMATDRIEGTILSQEKGKTSSKVELTLCQALIKGPKWDWLVEKACEIGVSRLVPLITARTVVKPSKPEVNDRWKRIALAASKQCGRSDVMEVTRPRPLAEMIKELPKTSLALIPWEKENTKTIRQAISSSPAATGSPQQGTAPTNSYKEERGRGSMDSPPSTAGNDVKKVTVFIGPEGGWESQEVDLAVRHGAMPVRLGPTLLRSETAGLVAVTLVLSELGVYS